MTKLQLTNDIQAKQTEAKDYLIRLGLLNAKPPIKGEIIANKKLTNQLKWRGIKLCEERKQTSWEFTLKQRGKDLTRTLIIQDPKIDENKITFDMNFCPKTAYNLIKQ